MALVSTGIPKAGNNISLGRAQKWHRLGAGVSVGWSVRWSVGVSVTATLTPAFFLFLKEFRAIGWSLSFQ